MLLAFAQESCWAAGTVTNCTEANLRAAMAGGGRVTFACDGTIALASTITNDANVLLDGSGHQVTLSGGNGVRVFVVDTNVSLVLLNLTIGNGFSDGGSGVLVLGGSVVATNCTFSQNTAWMSIAGGGAILNVGGTAKFCACRFVENQAGALYVPWGNCSGGAIYNNGALNADLCTFVSNTTSGASGMGQPGAMAAGSGCGGAIFNSDTGAISRSSFAENRASGGTGGNGSLPGAPGGDGRGGAIHNSGVLSMNATTLQNNGAMGGAGGAGANGHAWMDIATDGGAGGLGGLGAGGGLYNSGSALVVNSTFAGNFGSGANGGSGGSGGTGQLIGGNGGNGGSGGSGFGAIYDVNGQLYLTNCTVARNDSQGGAGGSAGAGGGHLYPAGHSGAPGSSGSSGGGIGGITSSGGTLFNTLLAANYNNCAGWVTDGGGNLSSDGSCAFTNSGSMNDTDPYLGTITNNGGPNFTVALMTGSPAIDAGRALGAPAFDERGIIRPQGRGVDIGAYEFQFTTAQITGMTFQTTSNLWLQSCGLPNTTYTLQTSIDLQHWSDVTNIQTGPSGMGELIAPDCCESHVRFYRLKLSLP